jgi:hypothetical protein
VEKKSLKMANIKKNQFKFMASETSNQTWLLEYSYGNFL